MYITPVAILRPTSAPRSVHWAAAGGDAHHRQSFQICQNFKKILICENSIQALVRKMLNNPQNSEEHKS